MQRIVECVPNFSEGRDRAVIKSITDEIEKVADVALLDVDPGADTNRTVVTMVGEPEAVVEAAFRAIRKAAEVIDMRTHSGAHARMGATDVCPFVPVRGLSMDDCAELARRLGERVGRELDIPVYLYENAASSEERRNLATVRAGEYEGLAEKLKDPHWKPDYGPATFNAQSGATVIGAREFLIAYNINLNTRDTKKARDIAFDIREKGRLKRDAKGEILRDADGNGLRQPGTLKACKAVGWYIEEYQMAQISMNLVDREVTPVHKAFDEVVDQAARRGLRVTGSELVGLIPLESMLAAGRHYLQKQNSTTAVPERELVRIAIQSMGLNEITPFHPDERIIEYQLEKDRPPQLVDLKLNQFADELSSDSPAPGGGSVSALGGSLSAALTAMVGVLTYGKKDYESVTDEVEKLAVKAQGLKADLLRLIDADTDAFNAVMAAMRLPRKSDEQKAHRDAALQDATKESIAIPLKVMEKCLAAIPLAIRMSEIGNQNSLSDAGVAILQAFAGLEGAAMNVLINLPGVTDEAYVADMKARVADLRAQAAKLYEDGTTAVFKTLS